VTPVGAPSPHPAPAPIRPADASAARRWLGALVDLIFPPFCPVCGQPLDGGRRDPLCGRCWDGMERLPPVVCRVCGVPLGLRDPGPARPSTGPTCGACRLEPPAFRYARAAARYGETVRRAVHAFKFGGRRALAAPLGDLLAAIDPATLPVPAPAVIVPVPLHPSRERARGFNQALLLARRLGRAWDLPVAPAVLTRPRATLPQTDLPADARRANVRDAFVVRSPRPVEGRHVILVDDVLTTGATVDACARRLDAAGATTVGVLTVARVG